MTGVEKIIAKIEQDSLAKSEELLARAEAQAGEVLAQAAAQAREASQAAIAAAREKAGTDVEAARARVAVTEKRALLRAKNEVIGEMVASALARLRALPAEEYFAVLAKLAAEYAQPGQGTMRLSRRDLDRLPPDFAGGLKDIAVDPQPAAIEDGFILAYGDIEQNCTFGALAAARMDDIKDALHAYVFAGGADPV